MSSTISSVSGYSSMMAQGVGMAHRRPDASKMVDDLFSQLDTAGNGYLTESDFATAFSGISSTTGTSSSSSTDSAASVSDVFSALDTDGDGKLTKDEMSAALQNMAQQLDAQFGSARMSQAMGQMPPPPPPGDQSGQSDQDRGLTKDQMSQMLSKVSSTDGKLASDLTSTLANFDAADSNGDGKVTFQEMMAYQQSNAAGGSSSDASSSSAPGTSSTGTSATTATTATSNGAAILKRVMDLLAAYRGNDDAGSNGISLTA